MADISKVNSLNGLTAYDIKDAVARGLLNGHSVGKNVPSDAVFTDTTYSVATISANGLMSAADKTKLDALASFVGITLTTIKTISVNE